MSLLTQRDPCRLPAWLGRTINMLYRTCRAPVHSITQPRQGTGDWVLPASAQDHALVRIDAVGPPMRNNTETAGAATPLPRGLASVSARCIRPARGPRRPSPSLHTYIYTSGQAPAGARPVGCLHTYIYTSGQATAGARPRAGVRRAFIHTYTLQVTFIHTYTLQVRPREPADFKRAQA